MKPVGILLGDGLSLIDRTPRAKAAHKIELSNGHQLYSDVCKLWVAEDRVRWYEHAASRHASLEREAILSALQTLDGATSTTPPADDKTDTRPVLDVSISDLAAATRATWDAVGKANDPPVVFRFGGLPARVTRDDDGRAGAQTLDQNGLRFELTRRVRCVRQTDAGPAPAVPPAHLLLNLLADPAPPLLTLRRVVETPVFGRNGRLLDSNGYHAEDGILVDLARDLIVPAVPAQPTSQDVRRALRLVGELLHDFPFTGKEERCNAIAAFLEPFTRELYDSPSPLHLFDAPEVGTGKGLLADALLYPACGVHMAVMTAPGQDGEWRKTITAALREAPVAVLLDNITGWLSSASLAAVLTARVWTDRLLGQSAMIKVPVRCSWLATANNVSLSTDIARRVVRTRLDAKAERPWQRGGFRHPNLRQWSASHRGELVWAALVLVRAWLAAGRPTGRRTLGSFESWAATLGGILENAGLSAFLGNLDEVYEFADSDGAVLRAFVAAWWEKWQGAEVGIADLFPLADETGIDMGRASSENGRKSALGQKLSHQRDRIIAGYRVVNTRTVKRAKQWMLVPMDKPTDTRDGEEVKSSEEFSHQSPIEKSDSRDTSAPGLAFRGSCGRGNDGETPHNSSPPHPWSTDEESSADVADATRWETEGVEL